MLSRRSVLLAVLLPALALCCGVIRADQAAGAPAAWKLAVVFSRANGQRTYVGAVADPLVPADLAESPPVLGVKNAGAKPEAVADPQADAEVWLVRDGAIRGVWVSTSQKNFGDIDATGRLVASRQDPGTLGALVKAAQPLPPPSTPKHFFHRQSCYLMEAISLQDLCQRSDAIVTGRVVGVLRNAYTAEPGSSSDQHTVYVVAVEADLKHDTSGSPAVLKVRMSGGRLSQRKGPEEPEIVEEDDDLTSPLLRFGERYCLFLASLRGMHPYKPPEGVLQDKSFHAAERDEYGLMSHWRAQILLKEGFTLAPRHVADESYNHWRFGSPFLQGGFGPQILDMPENKAIEAIRHALAP